MKHNRNGGDAHAVLLRERESLHTSCKVIHEQDISSSLQVNRPQINLHNHEDFANAEENVSPP